MSQGSFKVEDAHTANCTDRIYDKHCYSRYELIFVLDGSIRLNIEGERVVLEKDSGIIIEPLKYHIFNGNNTAYHRLILFFDQDFIPLQIRDQFFDNIENYYVFLSGRVSEYFRKYATILERKNSIYAPLLDAILTEVIYGLALEAHVRVDRPNNERIEKLRQIITFVEYNLDGEISLEDVAASICMSESAACQLFKDEMNISLKRYILLKKMTYAKSLLSRGVAPGKAALACGYKNYPLFYKMFLKVIGKTPTDVIPKT